MHDGLYALSAWRERRSLSVADLAARSGVTVATLRRLERGGEPAYLTTRRLADALEVEPHQLMHPMHLAERDPSGCCVCQMRCALEERPEADAVLLMMRMLVNSDPHVPLPKRVEDSLEHQRFLVDQMGSVRAG